MSGTQHPGLEEARLRMGTYLTTHTVHSMLDPHLEADEPVKALAHGAYEGRRGLLALTDRRLLFAQDAHAGGGSRSCPLEDIQSVEWTRHGNPGTITVRTARSCHELRRVSLRDGAVLVDELRASLAALGAEEPVAR